MGKQISSYRRLLKLKQRTIRVQKELPSGEEVKCRHCGHEYVGRFCPNCGQKASTKRFTLGGIVDETFEMLTNFDHSFIRTMVELFYRPGYMIRNYLEGHRVCYFKPMQLLAFMTTLYLAVTYITEFDAENAFHFSANIEGEDVSNAADKLKETPGGNFSGWLRKIAEAIRENELLSTLGAVIMFAIPARICFRRTPYGKKMNLTEHIYARMYMSCQALIVKTILLPFDKLGLDKVMDFSMVLIAILTVWDYAQLMDIKMKKSMWLCAWTFCLMFAMIVIVLCPIIGLLIYITQGEGGFN